MPRKRMIDPSFWLDEDMGEITIEARLFYIGLWSHADDKGRLEDKRKQLKAQIFPYNEINIEPLLIQLIEKNKIVLYTHESDNYIWIRNFLKWQKIEKPTTSRLPKCPEEVGEYSGSVRGEVGPKRSKEKLREVKIREVKQPMSSTLDSVKEIFSYWQTSLAHPNAKLDNKRERCIAARLEDGYSVERIKQAIDGIKKSSHHMGQNDRNTIYDDIELICRDGKHVDMFAEKLERKPIFNGVERYTNALLTTGGKTNE